MQGCGAYPAVAAAVLLGTRAVPGGGVGAAEQVLPVEPFFAMLAERGIHVTERWEPA